MFYKVPRHDDAEEEERNRQRVMYNLTGKRDDFTNMSDGDVTYSDPLRELFLWAVFMNRWVYIERTPQHHDTGIILMLNITSCDMFLTYWLVVHNILNYVFYI